MVMSKEHRPQCHFEPNYVISTEGRNLILNPRLAARMTYSKQSSPFNFRHWPKEIFVLIQIGVNH